MFGRRGADGAIAEHTLAEPGNFTVRRQNHDGAARHNLGCRHADRIAANINGGIAGHISTIIIAEEMRQSTLLLQNRYAGRLIVVEGIDGSGKSTQLSLLSQWLRAQGYAVAFSEWNSSPLVRQTTRRGKKKAMFTPATFSLIHATDFADRMESYILPLVKAGAVVCADRYAYTAFAREVARGMSRRWVRNLYRFALKPNLSFYFRVPLDVAVQRILGGRNAIKYYEAGMDLGLSRNIEESFRMFQGRILDEYEAMADEMGFHIIDATQTIEEQQQQMRAIVRDILGPDLSPGVLRCATGGDT
jgi:dTMP kinase